VQMQVPAGAEERRPPGPDPDEVENRPELKAARKKVLLEEREAMRARRDRVPAVDAFGSYDWDSSEMGDFEGSYTLGIVGEWDVFSGGRKHHAVRKSLAKWRAAKQAEESLRNHLRLDLQQATVQAVDAWERLGVARKSVESAEEALRITRERYEQGAADITELLIAEVGRTASRTRSVAARYDYLMALANLDRARGVLGAGAGHPGSGGNQEP
jgi:outer membrane protein